MNKLEKAAKNAVALVKPKKNEKILIITDKETLEVGKSLMNASNGLMVIIPTMKRHREEPPKEIAKLMLDYDVIFCPTKYSLTHTDALRKAKKKGARIATLPGITKEIFIRGLLADQKKMQKLTWNLEKLMKKAGIMRFVAKDTDIVFEIKGRKISAGDGDISHKSALHNLPAGETGTSPVEGRSHGYFTGKHRDMKARFIVRNGKVVKVVGNKIVKDAVKKYKNADNIAECSIGTNHGVKFSNVTLEAEKKFGTCHIAIGESRSMGGKVASDIHWDFVIDKPTIYLDSKKIMEKGKLCIRN